MERDDKPTVIVVRSAPTVARDVNTITNWGSDNKPIALPVPRNHTTHDWVYDYELHVKAFNIVYADGHSCYALKAMGNDPYLVWC